jgi:hypothetical protein
MSSLFEEIGKKTWITRAIRRPKIHDPNGGMDL